MTTADSTDSAITRNARYGVDETAPLDDPTGYYYERTWKSLSLASLVAAGGKVTRVRWLVEGRLADLSYVHGMLPDGTMVRLTGTPGGTTPRERMSVLIEWAREQGVFAKGCGLLDMGNWSTLRG